MNRSTANSKVDTALADTRSRNQQLLALVRENPKLALELRRQLAARGIPGEEITRIMSGEMPSGDLVKLLPGLTGAAQGKN
jgi:hypothetical protein